ncbi:hypothetical protein AYADHXPP_CDS0134 [Escherichia phage 235Ecol030PP]
MKMQSDFNSMFEEFQRQVDVPDQLLNALKRMAEGRNYYWGSSYETDESLSGRFSRGKKSLIRPGILINSIESIHLLTYAILTLNLLILFLLNGRSVI